MTNKYKILETPTYTFDELLNGNKITDVITGSEYKYIRVFNIGVFPSNKRKPTLKLYPDKKGI